ncbi:hypothetical protein ACFLZ8_03900 [Planctomycetota bacterium]
MKQLKTNLKRISVCTIILLTVLCWTVSAGELKPVYKQTLPSWWETDYEHQNFNPDMFDDFLQLGADGMPDGWEVLGYGSNETDASEVTLRLAFWNLEVIQQTVLNSPNDINFKEFAFHLRYKTENVFGIDRPPYANFTVKVTSDTEEKTYPIISEDTINLEDGTYYEVEICDRFKGQPASEVISIHFKTDDIAAQDLSTSLSIDIFDFRTKCLEPIEPNCVSESTCSEECSIGINNCEFTCDPTASQCSIVGSIDGEEFGLEGDCTFVAIFGYQQDAGSTYYILTSGYGSVLDSSSTPIFEYQIPRVNTSPGPEYNSTQVLIDSFEFWARPDLLETEFFTTLRETNAWPYAMFELPFLLDEVLQKNEPYTCQDAFLGRFRLSENTKPLPTDRVYHNYSYFEGFESYPNTSAVRQSWIPGGTSIDNVIDLVSEAGGNKFLLISALICYFTPFDAWVTYTFPEPQDFRSLVPNGNVTITGSAGNSWNTPTRVYVEFTDTGQNSRRVYIDGDWTNTSTITHEIPFPDFIDTIITFSLQLPLNTLADDDLNLAQMEKIKIGLEADEFASGYSDILIDSIEISAPNEPPACEGELNVIDEIVEGFNDIGLGFGSEYIVKAVTSEDSNEVIHEPMPSTIECGEMGTPEVIHKVTIRVSSSFEILPNLFEVARRVDKCGIQQQGASYLITMKIKCYCDPEDDECYAKASARMIKVQTGQILMSYEGKYVKCDDFNELIAKHLEDFQRSPYGHIPPFEFKNEDPQWKCPDER